MTLEDRFAERMSGLLEGPAPARIGLAVSGGSDSTALMHLAAGWATSRHVELYALTIDHGLRRDAAEEARLVRAQAEVIGVKHATIRWDGWDGHGNLQDAARRARRRLLWAWSRGLGHILVGHTMEDQAETVLRNLARGSGVAGLSGMSASGALPEPDTSSAPPAIQGTAPPPPPDKNTSKVRHTPRLLRPLLDMRRQDLRDWLKACGIAWSDDPSNEDDRFDRVRARKALAAGNALGLTVEGLAETAHRQRRARNALELRCQAEAKRLVTLQHGDVVFEREGLASLDAETRLHLVAHAVRWVSSSEYRPRLSALEGALGSAMAGQAATLHGCVLRSGRGGLRVYRESNALEGMSTVVDGPTLWDKRWLADGLEINGCTMRAAGEDGVQAARALPASGADGVGNTGDTPGSKPFVMPPHASLRAAPALFRGGELVALPPWKGVPCVLEFCPPMGGFAESLISR